MQEKGGGRFGDDRIVRGFRSENCKEIRKAFEDLVSDYGAIIFAYVRYCANKQPIPLSSEDVADVCETTLASIANRLQSGTEYQGPLEGLVKKIAFRRLIDWVDEHTKEWQLEDPAAVPDMHCDKIDELLEDIRVCFSKMSSRIKQTLLTDVDLFLQSGRWTTLESLCDKLRFTDPKLKEAAVKARRSRGRELLRKCLEKKGYHG